MDTNTRHVNSSLPAVRRALAALALLSAFTSAGAATITLTPSTTFQTIEGFGTSAFNPGDVDSAFINTMVNDLGMTALRLYIDEDFETTNDNADPNTLDLSRCNISGTDLQGHMRNLRYLKQAGLQKLLLTVFSPPAWMKDNGNIIGGSLRTDMYAEFTEWYSGFIKHIKQQTGIDVFAISPENEPAWAQSYWSCIYTAAQMRDITRELGRRFTAEGLQTKIFAAEDLLSNQWGSYFGLTNQDTEAKGYLHAIAVHAYEDGVAPSSGSAQSWGRLARAGTSGGKSTWMTETSGYSLNDNWLDQSGDFGKGAFTYACAVYSALRYGNVSLWLWLAPTNPPWGALQEGMCRQKVKTNKYYASKQFYRYIRPGAVRIDAQSDDSTVFVIAFEHAADQTLSLVLLNTSSSTKTATLAGTGWPSFTTYRSTSTDHCANVGASNGTVSLPAMSVVTLYGTGHVVGVRPKSGSSAAVAPVGRGALTASAFDLTGRLVCRAPAAAKAAVTIVGTTANERASGVHVVRVVAAN